MYRFDDKFGGLSGRSGERGPTGSLRSAAVWSGRDLAAACLLEVRRERTPLFAAISSSLVRQTMIASRWASWVFGRLSKSPSDRSEASVAR